MTKEEALKILRKDSLSNLVYYYSSEELQDAIDTIVSQPSLPSNLDEAAEEYSERFHDGKDKLYAFHGFRDGALWRDSQIQRLSNGIDGAAELSANDAMIKRQFPSVVYNTGLKCFDHSDLIKQFKAGAEWMAGQYEKIEGELVDWYSTSEGKDYCCGVKTIDAFEVPEGFYIRKKQ